uniref:Uncharacterized protein n=1 Tax=Podarcis muralis TaxID=64176 RepID=A0A670J5R3_PODMU
TEAKFYMTLNRKKVRTTPLLEYIKNRKLEKQRIREEKREERRRRESEKKRLREDEKRKRREEERRKRKEAEKQKKMAEKEIRIKVFFSCYLPSFRCTRVTVGYDKEQRDSERRFREKEPERQRYRLDDSRKHRSHYEFDKFVRRNEDEVKWGKGYSQDRGKKVNYNYSFTVDTVDKLGKEDKCDDMASKKERIRNKKAPAANRKPQNREGSSGYKERSQNGTITSGFATFGSQNVQLARRLTSEV